MTPENTRLMQPASYVIFGSVLGNYVHDNGDAGLAMMESFNADVSENTFEKNKYGFRMSVGCADNVFSDNLIVDSTRYAVIPSSTIEEKQFLYRDALSLPLFSRFVLDDVVGKIHSTVGVPSSAPKSPWPIEFMMSGTARQQ